MQIQQDKRDMFVNLLHRFTRCQRWSYLLKMIPGIAYVRNRHTTISGTFTNDEIIEELAEGFMNVHGEKIWTGNDAVAKNSDRWLEVAESEAPLHFGRDRYK